MGECGACRRRSRPSTSTTATTSGLCTTSTGIDRRTSRRISSGTPLTLLQSARSAARAAVHVLATAARRSRRRPLRVRTHPSCYSRSRSAGQDDGHRPRSSTLGAPRAQSRPGAARPRRQPRRSWPSSAACCSTAMRCRRSTTPPFSSRTTRSSRSGRAADVKIPPDATVIDTSGRTMMPGMMDLHAHLMILGHGNYGVWFPWIAKNGVERVMEISAKQLVNAGVTTAVDLSAPLKESLLVRDRINRGEIPGPAHADERSVDHALAGQLSAGAQRSRSWSRRRRKRRPRPSRLAQAGVDVIKAYPMSRAHYEKVVEAAHKQQPQGARARVRRAIGARCARGGRRRADPRRVGGRHAALQSRDDSRHRQRGPARRRHGGASLVGLSRHDRSFRSGSRIRSSRRISRPTSGRRSRARSRTGTRCRIFRPDRPRDALPRARRQAVHRIGRRHGHGHRFGHADELPHRGALARDQGACRHGHVAAARDLGGHPHQRPHHRPTGATSGRSSPASWPTSSSSRAIRCSTSWRSPTSRSWSRTASC